VIYRAKFDRPYLCARQKSRLLRISIPRRSPHPVPDAEPEIELRAVAIVRRPLVIGQDPETGRPLAIPVPARG
jgi:hypothetical protein